MDQNKNMKADNKGKDEDKKDKNQQSTNQRIKIAKDGSHPNEH